MMKVNGTYMSFDVLQNTPEVELDAGCIYPANHGADFSLAPASFLSE